MDLVSILIPSYNPRFFGVALRSALAQTYENIEIMVGDDSPGTEIEEICQAHADERLQYVRNPARLGFGGNFTACFERASGTYIKFLNDDDVLLSHCVTRMVHEFTSRPELVTLVTSRRARIDEHGTVLPDTPSTTAVAESTTCLDGRELGNRVLTTGLNVIGEPSTALFRKIDLEPEPGCIFTLNGTEYVCWADVVLWLRLMKKGRVVYIAEPASHSRRHEGQLQRQLGARCFTERFFLAKDALTLGYLEKPGQYVAALAAARQFIEQFLDMGTMKYAVRLEIEEVRTELKAELKQASRLLSTS